MAQAAILPGQPRAGAARADPARRGALAASMVLHGMVGALLTVDWPAGAPAAAGSGAIAVTLAFEARAGAAEPGAHEAEDDGSDAAARDVAPEPPADHSALSAADAGPLRDAAVLPPSEPAVALGDPVRDPPAEPPAATAPPRAAITAAPVPPPEPEHAAVPSPPLAAVPAAQAEAERPPAEAAPEPEPVPHVSPAIAAAPPPPERLAAILPDAALPVPPAQAPPPPGPPVPPAARPATPPAATAPANPPRQAASRREPPPRAATRGAASPRGDQGASTVAGEAGTSSVQAVAAPADAPILVTAPRYRRPPRPPDYPPHALDLSLTGTVLVRALVSPEGDTRETRIWRSSGHPALDAAAVTAVRRWAFEPARTGGRPVPAWVEVPVHFRLH